MTIKKRTSKLYRSFENFSRKYIMPTIGAIIGIAIMYWLSNLVFAFALDKTSSKGWAWLITVIFVIVFIAMGAANDGAEAKEKKRSNKVDEKIVSLRETPRLPEHPPLFPGDMDFPSPNPNI